MSLQLHPHYADNVCFRCLICKNALKVRTQFFSGFRITIAEMLYLLFEGYLYLYIYILKNAN